nr:hypothetical protein [Cardiobacterium sp. Marseille-Q4385]
MAHPHNPIEIYQSADGQSQVEVRFDTDTVLAIAGADGTTV